MSALALIKAVQELFPDGTLFEQVKPNERGVYSEDAMPWTIARIRLPDTLSRSMARTRLAQRVRVTVTITGMTYTSVNVVASHLDPLIQGVRPVAAGWSCSALDRTTTRDPVEDKTITLTTVNRHPVFAQLEYELIATGK